MTVANGILLTNNLEAACRSLLLRPTTLSKTEAFASAYIIDTIFGVKTKLLVDGRF
jgi:hypothetical protein